jgi:hypothetical protein
LDKVSLDTGADGDNGGEFFRRDGQRGDIFCHMMNGEKMVPIKLLGE